jgi:hypothetical protein
MFIPRTALLLFTTISFAHFAVSSSLAEAPTSAEADPIVGCIAPAADQKELTDPGFNAYATKGPFRLPTSRYLKNGGNECTLVSDVNLKIAAGYTLVNRYPIDAMLDLMDCMYKEGCYTPNGGVKVRDACLQRLCKCNQAMVKERISCEHSKNFDCDKIKKALENGGGAMLNGFHGRPIGHTVQVTYVDCQSQTGLYLDPNNPEEQTPFHVDDNGRITAPGGSMDDAQVHSTYVAQ